MAGLAAALVLTGCGSDGDGDGGGDGGSGKKDRGAAGSSSSGSSSSGGSDSDADSGSGSGSGGSEGAAGKGGSLEGSWVTTADGSPLALAITGKTATLLGEDVLCNGTTGDRAGSQVISLKCPKGNADRTKGRVESVDGKSMKVVWEGAGQDEFLKTRGGKLPDGLPTAGVPQP
ncbi:hypothetical protein AB0H82_27575 [Streptomyces sp. NPDC050732]|uniref:hypothetical protein n=1 Tax=Streptomyces sp. NPDC050732 TaxID=3154632 RepID=UPI003433DA87